MIITEPAAAIISDTFNLGITSGVRNRLRARGRRAVNPFSSQAYADGGFATGQKPSTAAPSPSLSATERRRSPLR